MKVLVAQVKSPNRPVLMDERVAKALVHLGTFQYFTAAIEAEPEKKPKKRTYKRRDLKAEG